MIGKILTPLLNIFKFHKKKIGLFFLSVILFSLILFPYNDLGDLVSGKIAEATGGSISLQFDELGVGIFPPGVKLSKVFLDAPGLPSLSAETLSLAPAIWGAITMKPGVKARIGGIFGGHLFLAGQKTSKDKKDKFDVSSEWSEISLNEIMKLNKSVPLTINGRSDGELTLAVDPTLVDSPSGKIKLKSSGLDFPTQSINLPQYQNGQVFYIPLELPGIKFSDIQLNASLADKKISIENSLIGSSKDDINGKIDGYINVQSFGYGGQFNPMLGSFELKLDLKVKEKIASDKKLGLLFLAIDQCKRGGESGTLAYRCKLSGSQFGRDMRVSTF